MEFELPKDVDRVRQLALKLSEYNERFAAKELKSFFDVQDIIGSLCKKTILRSVMEEGEIITKDRELLKEQITKKIENLLGGKLELASENERQAIKKIIFEGFENGFNVIQSYCKGVEEKEVFGGTGLPEIKKREK